MDDSELSQHIERKISSALNDEGGELSSIRQSNFDYYQGEKYGNEREGHSQVVTREVFETVEWALPSILRVFTGERPVTFLPEGAEDEQAAEQETDVINHLLFSQENGFLATYAWAKDCLMYPNGYAKVWADEVDKVTTERYQGLTIEQLTQLSEQEGVELVAAQAFPQTFPVPHETYSVELKVTRTKPVLRYEAVPPDEVLVDGGLTSVELDEAEFVCHRTKKTRSTLIQMGYDGDRLDAVGSDDMDTTERQNRRLYEEDPEEDDTGALREFTVEECYLLVDYDEDGIAERRRVVKIGNEIFENEEYDYCPLVAMTAILMPHQHAGMSLAEAVKDLQLISSTLMRQLLTNLYRINQPRKYVGENALVTGGMTMDALLNASAEVVPVRDPSAIIPEVIQSLGQHILPVMQQVTEQKMLRSGVNPNLSLDPNILRESTMGAFSKALDHASQRLEVIVRLMAETGIKSAMRKAHRLIRENFGSELSMKLRGEWVNVNPREWAERTNIKVSVGVGTQNKADKIQALSSVLAIQEKLMGLGMVDPSHIFNAVSELLQASGLEGAERFLINPNKQPLPPKQPDPLMMAQVESLKAQGQAMMTDAQSKMARAQIEGQKAQLERERAQFEASLKAREAELKAQIAQFDAQTSAGKAQAEVRHIDADTQLKAAQRVKTLEEARALDAETDAVETGVTDLLRGIGDAQTNQPA